MELRQPLTSKAARIVIKTFWGWGALRRQAPFRPNKSCCASVCGPLLALELFNGHRVQGSYPTHPMLAQRYDLLRDKARGWGVYDLQAQGLTHALQRE